MIESFKKMFRVSMFTSIFFIIVGLFLFLKPATTITTISYVIGGIFLVIGISYLIKYFSYPNVPVSLNLILGVVSSIIGLFLILKPTLIAGTIPFILGIWFVINSITKIQYSLKLKEQRSNAWISSIVIAGITLVWGIILLFNPFTGAVVITKVIGIFIFVYALLDLIQLLIIKKNLTDIKKGVTKIIE